MEKNMNMITNSMPNTEREPYTFICSECGVKVVMDIDEQNWYESLNYGMPKRCSDCRKLRRDDRNKRRRANKKAVAAADASTNNLLIKLPASLTEDEMRKVAIMVIEFIKENVVPEIGRESTGEIEECDASTLGV